MALDLPALLRAEGVEVLVADGWRSNDRPGDFTPIACMSHHTASGSGGGEFPSLSTVVHGRAGIPGPLCNLLVGRLRQGRELSRVYVITDGRANDSGTGMASVLDRIRSGRAVTGDATAQGSTNGNRWFFDIEVENNGVGEPYEPGQIDALIRCNAAIAKAMGWNPDAHWALHHREWTARKIDMSWRGDLRGRISAYLRSQATEAKKGLSMADVDEILRRLDALEERVEFWGDLTYNGRKDGKPVAGNVSLVALRDRFTDRFTAVDNQVGALAAAMTALRDDLRKITAPTAPSGGQEGSTS